MRASGGSQWVASKLIELSLPRARVPRVPIARYLAWEPRPQVGTQLIPEVDQDRQKWKGGEEYIRVTAYRRQRR
jgi:hypothetical protein